jgi:hypothetical protein
MSYHLEGGGGGGGVRARVRVWEKEIAPALGGWMCTHTKQGQPTHKGQEGLGPTNL